MSVTFATCCWEKDWKHILLRPGYLEQKQIANHCTQFTEKILVINNVQDLAAVKQAAQQKIDEGILTRMVVAGDIAEELLSFFCLKREDFRPGADAHFYPGVTADWIYYNALGPLAAIYSAASEYLLYLTGDVRLDKPLDWVRRAIRRMEKKSLYKVANPTWNDCYEEAKRESQKRRRGFYVSDRGFSDQLFLVRTKEFQAPIYGEIREDAGHFPRGDVFEKRVFSAMRNRGWLRITYAKGSYIHENF